MLARWSRLAAALFLIGLLASRLSLVLHELVGHGAVATALGGQLTAYRLFLFGGGWVSYAWGPEHGVAASLVVSMGGVALEVIAAAIALLLARRARGALARLALVGFATADMLHAGFYLAVGAHHGFGDGRLLRAVLGAAAPFVVWTVVAATVAAGFLLARRLAALAGDWTGATTRVGQAGALVAAALAAGALHGGLTLAERVVTRDDTYARIMKPEAERRAEREAARLAREARKRGAPLDPAQLEAIRAELARRSRELPLAPILITALVLACGAGVWRGLGGPRGSGDAAASGASDAVGAASSSGSLGAASSSGGLGAASSSGSLGAASSSGSLGAASSSGGLGAASSSGSLGAASSSGSLGAASSSGGLGAASSGGGRGAALGAAGEAAEDVAARDRTGEAAADVADAPSLRGSSGRPGATDAEAADIATPGAPSWRGLAPLGVVTAAALGLVALLRLFE